MTVGEEPFRITQSRQVLHVDDFCNECGNCATFCTHQGKPYQDKPRLFLKESDFELEDDNAFWIARREQGWSIRRRTDGKTARLMIKANDGEVYYDDEFLAATLAVEDFHLKRVELKARFPRRGLAARCSGDVCDSQGCAGVHAVLAGVCGRVKCCVNKQTN